MTEPILTEMEQKLIDRLGSCYSLWKTIYGNTRVEGPQKAYDLYEFSSKIHDLQYRVMAQAARRAYPGRFR